MPQIRIQLLVEGKDQAITAGNEIGNLLATGIEAGAKRSSGAVETIVTSIHSANAAAQTFLGTWNKIAAIGANPFAGIGSGADTARGHVAALSAQLSQLQSQMSRLQNPAAWSNLIDAMSPTGKVSATYGRQGELLRKVEEYANPIATAKVTYGPNDRIVRTDISGNASQASSGDAMYGLSYDIEMQRRARLLKEQQLLYDRVRDERGREMLNHAYQYAQQFENAEYLPFRSAVAPSMNQDVDAWYSRYSSARSAGTGISGIPAASEAQAQEFAQKLTQNIVGYMAKEADKYAANVGPRSANQDFASQLRLGQYLGSVRSSTASQYAMEDRAAAEAEANRRQGVLVRQGDQFDRLRGQAAQEIYRAQQQQARQTERAARATERMAQEAENSPSAISNFARTLRTISSTFLRVAGSAWVLERMGSGALHIAEAPYDAIVSATTDSRRFEMGMGGGPQAHEANLSLMSRINQYPMSLSDARQATIDMTRAGIAPSQAGQYLGTLTNLQAINPQATSEAVTRAMDEALLGNVRGLRNVVRIDPDQLAQLIGRDRATDFRGRPELLLQALSTYGRIFAPPGASDSLNALPGVQMQHIRDQFSSAFSQIGDSGVFNVIVDRMKATADELAKYFDPNNAQWVQHAKSISDSLARVFTNVTDALAAGLAKLAGVDSVAKTPEGIVGGVDLALQHLAKWSDTLPAAAANFGDSMNKLLVTLNRLADVADEIVRTKQQAEGIGYGLSRGALQAGGDLLDQSPWPIMGLGGAVRGRMTSGSPNPADYSLPIPGMGTPVGSGGVSGVHGPSSGLDPFADIRGPLEAAMYGQSSLLAGYSLDKSDRIGLLQKDSSAAMKKILDSGVLTPENRRYFQATLDDTYDADRFTLADQALAARGRANLSIARGGFGLAEAAKSDPFLASVLYQQAFAGTTANANSAAMAEQFTGDRVRTFGYGALSIPEQLEVLKGGTAANLAAIKQSGVGLPTSDSLIASLSGRQSTSSQQADVYSAMLGYAEQTQASARRAKDANPTPENQAAFQAATAQVQEYEAELNKARLATNAFFEGFVQYGNQAQHTLEGGLGQALSNVETHARNTTAQLREMGRSLLNEFNSYLVKGLFSSVLGGGNGIGVGNGLGGLLGAGISGLFSQTAGSTGAAAAGIPSDAVLVAGAAAANGSVFGGGLRFLSNGAVVGRPHLAVVGERADGIPEAVIPMLGPGRSIPIGVGPSGLHAMLPGGRTVPAAMYAEGGIMGAYAGVNSGPNAGGGGGLVVNVNNFIDPVQLTAVGLHGGAGVHIENNMMKNLGPGGKLRKQLSSNH